MNIFNKIKGLFAADTDGADRLYSLNDPQLWSGTDYSAGSMSEITYYTCLKVLSESVAKLPLKLYRQTERGTVKATDKSIYNKLKLSPNRAMTATSFWAAVVMQIYHYGNSVVYPLRKSALSPPSELIILDPSCLHVYADNAKLIDNNAALWYIYTEPRTGKTYKFDNSSVLHFKTMQSLDGITGLSVREVLQSTIDASLKAQKFVSKLYDKGLTGKIAVEYTADLSELHRKQAINTISAAAEASSAFNFIPVPYGLKLTPLDIKLTDAQFLELKKYSSLQIAAAFGIKPNQLNDYSKSSYANSEQQQQAFLTDTLLVLLKGIEEELTVKLLSDREINEGYFFKFNVDVILRADFATRMEGYAKARQNGWLNANEIRDKEDLPAISDADGGNVYLVNGNMVPMALSDKDSE